MKSMRLLLTLSLSCFVAAAVYAQGGPQSTGINASLLKLFGDIKAFDAQGEIRMTDSAGKEISAMPVRMAMLNGKLRTEMDMSQMKGGNMPPESAAMLKQTGMDRMHMLITPESKTAMLIYPGLQAYAVVPDEAAKKAEGKVDTKDLGKETVLGHPCVKKKLTMTGTDGKTEEALVWAATDLKNFPVKMEMKQEGTTINIEYKNPSLQAPDAKLFETPSGYTKYDSVQALMQAAMMKMFGGKQ